MNGTGRADAHRCRAFLDGHHKIAGLPMLKWDSGAPIIFFATLLEFADLPKHRPHEELPWFMFWGGHYGKFIDPFGHLRGVAAHKKDVTPEECAKAATEWGKQKSVLSGIVHSGCGEFCARILCLPRRNERIYRVAN